MQKFTGWFVDELLGETIQLGEVEADDALLALTEFRTRVDGAGLGLLAPTCIEVVPVGHAPTDLNYRRQCIEFRMNGRIPDGKKIVVQDAPKQVEEPTDAMDYVDTKVDVEAVW